MKKIIAALSLLPLLADFVYSQDVSIIPEPVSVSRNSGFFVLSHSTNIETLGISPNNIENSSNKAVISIASQLAKQLGAPTGYSITVDYKTSAPSAIRLMLNSSVDEKIGKEGYNLDVSPTSITIKANQPAGLFYGVQTLLQLFPEQIAGKMRTDTKWQVPCISVTDYPRFGWRGLMLDVSRHFFTKDQVKDFIDQMVKYKYNLLHLHLTDDEGWRIEIKSLPKLTSVGAWNVRRIGTFGDFSVPTPDEPRDNGGFYTQDDIRELVQYAKDRFVNILPEMDVPGHSMAAIATYPELSCTAGAENYRVISGEKFMIWPEKGHFYGLVDNTLCPANEKVYPFLDKVFTELAQLFPFEYIHVGGDECARNFWEKSDAIKSLMQKEKLKNLDEVQSYFEKRVEKIVESKGKKTDRLG